MAAIISLVTVFLFGIIVGLEIAKKLGAHWTWKERKVDE